MKKRIGSILLVLFLMVSIFEVSNMSASAVGKIWLNKTAITLLVGEKYWLSVKNIPKSGKVTWTSTSKSNAAISKKGVCTAKKQGRATIWAKFFYRSGRERRIRNFFCMVTVTGKSESASNAVTKPSVQQNENEIETNQPSCLHIPAIPLAHYRQTA